MVPKRGADRDLARGIEHDQLAHAVDEDVEAVRQEVLERQRVLFRARPVEDLQRRESCTDDLEPQFVLPAERPKRLTLEEVHEGEDIALGICGADQRKDDLPSGLDLVLPPDRPLAEGRHGETQAERSLAQAVERQEARILAAVDVLRAPQPWDPPREFSPSRRQRRKQAGTGQRIATFAFVRATREAPGMLTRSYPVKVFSEPAGTKRPSCRSESMTKPSAS